MSEIENLLHAYEEFVRLPWDRSLSGPEKVWFVIYDPAQERRLRLQVPEFEMATKKAGHPWAQVDLTDTFAQWMAQHDYRDAYFEQPEDMELALQEFTRDVIALVREKLTVPEVNEETVVAVTGLASLFGLTRASTVLEDVNSAIRGRLLVFFPGRHDGSNYRLLDARDGWNYLAIPITVNDRK
jgi:hypothetical protein